MTITYVSFKIPLLPLYELLEHPHFGRVLLKAGGTLIKSIQTCRDATKKDLFENYLLLQSNAF